jgi:hypothetical protein
MRNTTRTGDAYTILIPNEPAFSCGRRGTPTSHAHLGRRAAPASCNGLLEAGSTTDAQATPEPIGPASAFHRARRAISTPIDLLHP